MFLIIFKKLKNDEAIERVFWCRFDAEANSNAPACRTDEASCVVGNGTTRHQHFSGKSMCIIEYRNVSYQGGNVHLRSRCDSPRLGFCVQRGRERSMHGWVQCHIPSIFGTSNGQRRNTVRYEMAISNPHIASAPILAPKHAISLPPPLSLPPPPYTGQ